MAEQVPLLTVEDAMHLRFTILAQDDDRLMNRLDAIASGRAVVVPAITRGSLREALHHAERFRYQDDDPVWRIDDFTAALRKLGIEVKE